jgi:phosphoserine phosphatase RsbU/P
MAPNEGSGRGRNPVTWRVAGTVVIAITCAVACAVLAVFVLRGTVSAEMGSAITLAILYTLPIMALQAATEQPLRRHADSLRFPLDWILYAGTKLILGLAAAGIGSLLALLFGIVKHWQELELANRMVVVVSVIVSCLIRVYGTTRHRLEQRNRELEARVEAEARTLRLHEQDFERAKEIQQALMPQALPEVSGCGLAGGCQPANSVGGDYYDAIRIADSKVAIAIADVSGKGMGAALLMSNLQAIVRAFASGGLAPVELCSKANQIIAANVAPGKYITFFYGLVDRERMHLDYCCAGHNPPILQRRGGEPETLGKGGPVLGVFSDAGYEQGGIDLHPGDRLVLFTDGITEAMNSREEEFGEERLMALLDHPHASADECRDQIMTAVERFSDAGLADDATVLVVTVS